MSGFFDGLSTADHPMMTTNNAGEDYARLAAIDPGQFSGFFSRRKKAQPGISSSPLPPIPGLPQNAPTSPAGPPAAPKPSSSLSSAPGLIDRVLGAIRGTPPDFSGGPAAPQGANPGANPYMMPPMPQGAPMGAPAPPQAPQPHPLSPLAASALPPNPFVMQTPPGMMPPSPPGGNNGLSPYGNGRFGGHTFGGHTFGGHTFGRSAQPGTPAGVPVAPDVAPALPGPQTPMSPLQELWALAHTNPNEQISRAPGFRGGGFLRLRRGGYPAFMVDTNLPPGMPERFARGGDTSPDYIHDRGVGDGRSDNIRADLSPGEFVMDGETTSLLGNGNSDAGARGMEAIRQEIRRKKGKALAKGKFSPDAPPPDKLANIAIRAAGKKGKR